MSLIKIFLLIFYILSINSHPEYKLNTLFYFDPETNNKCDETNYWTPFNQKTTCYRFINLELKDTSEKETIKLMLDHNIAYSDFNSYKLKLKEATSKWKKVSETISIIDEETIYKIMNYTSKPNLKNKKIKPYHYLGYYYMNSYYINNEKEINEYGYWTNTIYNKDYVYTINKDGQNTIVEKDKKRGIRPVIKILKKNINIITKEIDITDIIIKKIKNI